MFDIESYIMEQVKDLDIKELVREEIRRLIGDQFRNQYECIILDNIDALIKMEVAAALEQEIRTDDGWGNIETIPSFETFFKREFKRRLEQSYNIQQIIKSGVKDRLDALFNREFRQVADKIIAELVAEKKK